MGKFKKAFRTYGWITKRKAKRRQQKDKSYKINILWDFFFIVLWRP